MKKVRTFATAALVGTIISATPVCADGTRSNTIAAAKDLLEEYQASISKIESGGKACELGILSSWYRVHVTRVSDHGIQNGLLVGDKIVEINGDNVTADNWAILTSDLSPGDKLSVRVLRDGTYTDLDVECGDSTSLVLASMAMVEAASNGQWQACLKSSYEIDRLNGEPIAFTAYWRNECSEAERCSDRRCKNLTSSTGVLFYDYQRLGIEELAAIGELDQLRSSYLNAVTWLENNGFRRFARELESDWKRADSPDVPRSSSSVPKVASKTAFGTCFAVSPTEVLTSHHVVADANLITVTFPGLSEIGAIVTQHSQSTDLAVLKINGQAPAILPLAAMRSLVVGEEVFTIGYPVTDILGSEPKFTEGSVSALSGLKGDASYFQMSVPVQPGNSGGPVVNLRGEVVGVVASTAAIEAFYTSSGALPQNINWASKSDYARLMFDPPVVQERAKNRSEAIQMANAAICRVKSVTE